MSEPLTPALGPDETRKRTSAPLVVGETVAVSVCVDPIGFVSDAGLRLMLVTPCEVHVFSPSACGSSASRTASLSSSNQATMTSVPTVVPAYVKVA